MLRARHGGLWLVRSCAWRGCQRADYEVPAVERTSDCELLTFMTDTIGSVSSCRMPTTDMACSGWMGGWMDGWMDWMDGRTFTTHHHLLRRSPPHTQLTLCSRALHDDTQPPPTQSSTRLYVSYNTVIPPTPPHSPRAPCCAAARCSPAPAASCRRTRGCSHSTRGPPLMRRWRGWRGGGGGWRLGRCWWVRVLVGVGEVLVERMLFCVGAGLGCCVAVGGARGV